MNIEIIDTKHILCLYPKEQLIACYLLLEKPDEEMYYLAVSLNSHSDVAKMLRARVKKPYDVIDGGFFIIERDTIIIKYEVEGSFASSQAYKREIVEDYLEELGFSVILNPDYEFNFD